jgi:adenosylcobinamide kinase/adenosylcobinamide-phosphate guanylyltransferase
MEHTPLYPLPPVTLVLGGARSGKSRYAERLASGLLSGASVPLPALYIATAEAGDMEMAARILAHRARRGPHWHTVEAPLAMADAVRDNAITGRAILVDCLTLWLSNLMHAEHDVDDAADRLTEALQDLPCPVVLVANEVGLGIVPDTPLGRRFRDAAGRLNMRLAEHADRVVFIAAGLPLLMKDRPVQPLVAANGLQAVTRA